jgi:DNA-binding CsgD family transcriptional regulator
LKANTLNTTVKDLTNKMALELKETSVADRCHKKIKKILLIKNKQCSYVIDWKQSKLTYSRGIKNMLGYAKADFGIDDITNYTHPDDVIMVVRVVSAYITHVLKSDIVNKDLRFNCTYRLLKKDGTYMRILRQSSPYEIDASGKLISHLSILTDISFIESLDNKVEWDIFSDSMEIHNFKQLVYKDFIDFFTPRELEIILLIKAGNTNKIIAEKLFVSFHTVVAHRKNILLKSCCHNTKELLAFTSSNGIT